ncbi:MAG: TIGR03016 family PEP-CTERM system-associated outer membrane protein [Betaproteobacteria bacterium]|nr:TIGR03016 family PEP-CTERM system-associated outer membrane protein [Betaproteobacteria bacterium]
MYTPTFRVIPSVVLSERYTDNAAQLTSAAAQSDWETDAAADLHIDYRSARANAMLDYRVNRLLHGHLSSLDTTQHNLSSSATLEAIEKWLFLDARASIAQQNRSAFGVAGIADVTSTSENRVETTTYQVSPYIRGKFTEAATYFFRVNGAETHTGGGAIPDSKTYQWNGFVKNAPSAGRLGWSVDGNAFSFDNNTVDKRYNSIVRGTVTFEIDGQLHMSLSAGRESSDLDGLGRRNTNSPGLGLEWSPSQRTQMAAVTQKRFFGNDHLVALAHRTALTARRFSSTREIAFSTNDLAGSSPVSVNSLLLDLLASAIPDPNARAEAAQRRFTQTGIPATSGIQDGLLTVRPFLSRHQEASVALIGTRNTATISLGRREQRAIDGNSTAPGSGTPIEEFRQFGANAAWAYRLSPVSTLQMVASYLRTKGLFLENLSTTQRLQSLFFVTQLGPRTSASLGVQRTIFDSTVINGYRENAVVASLSLRF